MALTVQTIPQRLSALKAPASSLAAYTGIGGGTLSNYINGTIPIPGNRAEIIDKAMADFEEFAKLTAPLPINFSDVNALRECLRNIKDSRLRIAIVLSEPPMREKAFGVQFKNQKFFQQRHKNQLIATDNFFQAAMVTAPVAEQLIDIFDQLGYLGCKAVENRFEVADGPTNELSIVWPGK